MKFGTEHRRDMYFQQPEWRPLRTKNSPSKKNIFQKCQNLRDFFVNGILLKIYVLQLGFPQKCIAKIFFCYPRLHLVSSSCVLNNIIRSVNRKKSMVTWWKKIVEIFPSFPAGFRQIMKTLRHSFGNVELYSQKLWYMRSPGGVKDFCNLKFRDKRRWNYRKNMRKSISFHSFTLS